MVASIREETLFLLQMIPSEKSESAITPSYNKTKKLLLSYLPRTGVYKNGFLMG